MRKHPKYMSFFEFKGVFQAKNKLGGSGKKERLRSKILEMVKQGQMTLKAG
jgi:hypothetical protein